MHTISTGQKQRNEKQSVQWKRMRESRACRGIALGKRVRRPADAARVSSAQALRVALLRRTNPNTVHVESVTKKHCGMEKCEHTATGSP
jgi:hypothetical protein